MYANIQTAVVKCIQHIRFKRRNFQNGLDQ